MKILRLRFRNINSLKDDNELDFTIPPLSDTGIFAITGPTGSGKSTILDAITLALFNTTPRTGKLSKTEIESHGSIITRNTSDCMAEVEYEANGKSYRSKWEISRARTGTLRDYHMEIAELPENNLLDLKRTDVPAKNAEIIGLNYEQFIKSVLLSQGDFARFLKAKADERGELLEKITGTEIYRLIGQAAYERMKAESEKYETQKSDLARIEVLTKEQKAGLQQQQVDLQVQAEQLGLQLDGAKKYRQLKQEATLTDTLIAQLTQKLADIQREKEAFVPMKQKLALHEELLSLKGDALNLMAINENLWKQKSTLAVTVKRCEGLEKTAESQTIEHQKCTTAALNAERRATEMMPVVANIRALDTDIEMAQQKHRAASKQAQLLQSDASQLRNEVIAAQTREQQTEASLAEARSFINNNALLNSLEQDIAIIKDRESTLLVAQKYAQQLIDQYRSNKFVATIALQSWPNKQLSVVAELQGLTLLVETLSTGLQYSTSDLSEINDKIELLRETYTHTTNVLKFVNTHAELQTKIADLQQREQALTQLIAQKTTDTQQVNGQLKILQKDIEIITALYERQQLEAKYADDRMKLRANEPCFLCGATHHPYVQSYESHEVQTKKQLQQKNDEIKLLSKKLRDTELAHAQYQTEHTANRKQHTEAEQQMLVLRQQYNELCATLGQRTPITDKQAWEVFLSATKQQGTALAAAKKQIEAINSHTQQISILNNVRERCEQVATAQNAVNEVVERYANYLAHAPKGANILVTLQKWQTDFVTQRGAIQQYTSGLEQLQVLVKEKNATIERIASQIEQQKIEVEKEAGIVQQLTQSRTQLAGTKTVDSIEQELRQAQKSANNQLHSIETQLAQTKTSVASLHETIEQLNISIKEISEQETQLSGLLMPKLRGYGLQSAADLPQYLLTDQQISDIKTTERKLDQAEIANRQTLADSKTKVSRLQVEMQAGAEGYESLDLPAFITTTEKTIREYQQTIGVIANQLAENEKREINSLQLQTAIALQAVEYDKWRRLNGLIGDSAGKKFSKFAQQLTLRHLIHKANTHLKTLNERYVISAGGKEVNDDLIVYDTFQANTIRSVRTLSGGESFLISLALALGLSDLAGQNTKIESLFIDEGFGSLDQHTLDVAISSLEKLQAENNRTIGVISHVEALKERIKTRIELEKSSTGYSRIKRYF